MERFQDTSHESILRALKLSISMHQHFTSVNVMTFHFSSMSDGSCNFKGVIISSLHGWIILSFHPFLNRFLDSWDSFKFPYYKTLCSRRLSSLFNNNNSNNNNLSDLPGVAIFTKMVMFFPFFHTPKYNSFYILDVKALSIQGEKPASFFTSLLWASDVLFYASIPMHIQFSQEVSWYTGKPYCLSHIKTSSSFYLFLHFKVVFIEDTICCRHYSYHLSCWYKFSLGIFKIPSF